MPIPIYVVTGFLDAGKTTFLNHLLNRWDWRETQTLLLQFEAGEESFRSKYGNCEQMGFAKKTLEKEPEQIVAALEQTIRARGAELDEIWIEWNGVTPFSQLQSLLLSEPLRGLCKVQKVIHVADCAQAENLLGRTGGALPEQISNSDFVILRTAQTDAYKRVSRLVRGINPGVSIYELSSQTAYEGLYKQLFRKKMHPVHTFLFTTVLLVLAYLAVQPAATGLRLNTVVNVFLGIILQAIPFLLIGVLLSSAIQIFVPKAWIERRFPKSLGLGMLVAIVGGFCLPVCDCASIPIFRSLVKKGVPLPVAITFMTASPVINPVVMLSTYYAFSGNAAIVVGRVSLGVLASILIGLVMALRPVKGSVLSGGGLDGLMCSCGCYEDTETIDTWQGKAGLFLRHSQAEFFDVGRYLVIGSLVAAVFQTLGTDVFTKAQTGAGLVVSILIMMVMAFVLSLCSSSDAVVARSFARQFPMGAMMGFLVFGPMMDIKNVMMLSSGFSKRFIGKLLAVSFVVCFAVVLLFSRLGGM